VSFLTGGDPWAVLRSVTLSDVPRPREQLFSVTPYQAGLAEYYCCELEAVDWERSLAPGMPPPVPA
jgi:hypothetical protein